MDKQKVKELAENVKMCLKHLTTQSVQQVVDILKKAAE